MHEHWWSVDSSPYPPQFVTYLQQMRSGHRQQSPEELHRSYEHLDVQPGHAVLDAGCGLGDLARNLARLVVPKGRVLGIDYSATLIAEARHLQTHKFQTLEDVDLPLDFQVGDIQRLELASNTFDRVHADSVLQHVIDPEAAVSELVRVVRPGGRIVVQDADWETMDIASDLREVSHCVESRFRQHIRNPDMGHRLEPLLRRSGLVDVTAVAIRATSQDLMGTWRWMLSGPLRELQAEGTISACDAEAWRVDLNRRFRAEGLVLAVTLNRVTGHKG